MIKLIYVIYSSIFISQLLAYPVDYNETSAEITRDALIEFITTLRDQDYVKLLQDYNDEILPIDNETHEEINSIYNSSSQRLLDLQEDANNINANITDCLDNLHGYTADEYYYEYNQECNKQVLSAGENILRVATNKQQVVFFNKYNELMHNFNGCMSAADPAPKICAGVVEATLLEVQRILPAVKANPALTQRKLKQQIWFLHQCTNRFTTNMSQHLLIQFSIFESCILDKINIA